MSTYRSTRGQLISKWLKGQAVAVMACAVLTAPMIGCGSHGDSASNIGAANQPPIDDTRGGTVAPSPQGMTSAPANTGMSTRKKVVLLVGAAALYYLYKKHQANNAASAAAQNSDQTYYISKNGRVYYRDANHQAHWVTPPAQGIQVPYEEAQSYQGFQGYNGSQNGESDLSRYASPAGGM